MSRKSGRHRQLSTPIHSTAAPICISKECAVLPVLPDFAMVFIYYMS